MPFAVLAMQLALLSERTMAGCLAWLKLLQAVGFIKMR